MNDRYLFKAKRKNWRELPKEEWWVIGSYVYTFAPDKECPVVGLMKENHFIVEENGNMFITDPTTLCQCTGLKDKNGTLIWENDVIKESSCGYVGLVKYKDCEYLIDWSDFPYIRRDIKFWIEERELRVIGNIFDNPELLEVE